MNYDRQIHISVGASRRETHWKPQTLLLSDLYEKLRLPVRSTETLTQYLQMGKGQQDDLKDVGGFMAGSLAGDRRKASAVTGRDVVTLDFDTVPAYGTDGIMQTIHALQYGFCVYSTRKHQPTAPRLRVLFPLDRTVTADEYEAIARRLASFIGIQMADPTTFEPSRLMFWPSCCADGAYLYETKDAPFVPADAILGTYTNWRDCQEWPQVPGAANIQKLAGKQGDPTTKDGLVGAFCREFDVFSAMDAFLPGVYAPVDNDPNRFTFLGGSTAGGAVVYDNGKFLYSHHATDPCGGKLVNAFDLVRIHKYGDLDDEAKADTPSNKMPSFLAMSGLAGSVPKVVARMVLERRNAALEDFKALAASDSAADNWDPDWAAKLKQGKNGPAPTIDNVMIILDGDPELRKKFALNQFAGRGEVLGLLPWNQDGKRRLWSDTDSNGLYWYMEKTYDITKRGSIDAALDVHAAIHAFNDVTDYLNGLKWDLTPRLERVFIDYLGAEDSLYNRTICRKAFMGAVARALNPGCKFDYMTILCGPQGIGKSTLIDKMSKGWFNDSIRTFEGKNASELLPGVWLVEVAELDAFRTSEVSCIKQFLSLRADRYRAAYGRRMNEFPRRCAFFGTCNQMDFLTDTTGNRRFWPVDVGEIPHTKTVWRDLTSDVIDQIWAEAKAYWHTSEPLYLQGEVERMALEKQEQHREASVREGLVAEFVARKVPSDWFQWSLDRRRDFWGAMQDPDKQGLTAGSYTLVDRDRIAPIEVWCELFGGGIKDMQRRDTREINAILSNLPGWKRAKSPFRDGPYAVQRGFIPD